MKTAEIKIGGLYAVVPTAIANRAYDTEYRSFTAAGRRRRPTRTDVHDGFNAAPVRVVAIGRYRMRRTDACTLEVSDDHYTTTVRVQTVDVAATLELVADSEWSLRQVYPRGDDRIGYPNGLKLTSSNVVWVDDVVGGGDVVMPWEDFLMRRAEAAVIAAEVEKDRARLDELRTEIVSVIERKIVPDQHHTTTTTTQIRMSFAYQIGDGRWRIGESGMTEDEPVVGVETIAIYPVEAVEGLGELMSEFTEIRRRLECAR